MILRMSSPTPPPIQMHVRHVADPAAAKAALEAAFPAFTAMAHEIQPNLVRRGGGIRGWEAKVATRPLSQVFLWFVVPEWPL